jgi:hypothetical protein
LLGVSELPITEGRHDDAVEQDGPAGRAYGLDDALKHALLLFSVCHEARHEMNQ